MEGTQRDASAYAVDAGTVFGAIDEDRDNAIDLELDKELSEADRKKLMGYHAGGAVITGVKYAGDGIQRLIDAGLTVYTDNVKSEASAAASQELKKISHHGVDTVTKMLREKFEEEQRANESSLTFRDTDDTESDYRRTLKEIVRSYATAAGIDETMHPKH